MEEKSAFVLIGNLAVRRSLIGYVTFETVFNEERQCDEIKVTVFYSQPYVLARYLSIHPGEPAMPYAEEVCCQCIHAHFAADDEKNARAFFDDVTR